MLFLIFLGVLAVSIYLYIIKPNKHWQEKGIPYIKPLPILGNMGPNFLQRRSFAEMIEDMYKAFPDKRYVGIHQFSQPTLMIRDLDLIKKVTVKEFDVFPDHKGFTSNNSSDTLATKNLFSVTNDSGWRDLRALMSPAFTSSKMKNMFVLMEQCADQFTRYLVEKGGEVTLEVKEAYSRFAIDVIGTTAFGVDCDSMADPQNQFFLMGKRLNSNSFVQNLRFFAFSICPIFFKLFNVQIFGEEVSNFFKGVIKETIRVREEKGIVRPDIVHLLMEARKGQLKYENETVADGFAVVEESDIGKQQKKQKVELTDDDIAAQAFVFFFAGFDTISTATAYITYELAVNPEVQDKLWREIEDVIENNNGKITYETLLGMKYLDCVVTETLRKWPPAVFMDRLSVKPFTIAPEQPGEVPLYLDKGTVLWVPVYAIHRDPKYYPDPEKFDPDRFNEENKKNIQPFSYLPFGTGPRSCIGSRFALLETKLLIVKLLQKFEFVPVENTPIPLKLDKKGFPLLPKGGIPIGFKPRIS